MEPTPSPKPRKTPLLPANDVQLAALAVAVAAYWNGQPWLTLRFTSAKEFDKLANAYAAAVASRQQAGTARPVLADELLDLDHLIDSNLYRVKNALTARYDKKKAVAHYPTVGIVRYLKEYIIDRERTRRGAALTTLVAGLVSEKIDGGDYGTAFWQPIAQRYNELLPLLANASGDISQAVALKDGQRLQVEQTLYSVAKVIDANYPVAADYRAELRAAGFLRETY